MTDLCLLSCINAPHDVCRTMKSPNDTSQNDPNPCRLVTRDCMSFRMVPDSPEKAQS